VAKIAADITRRILDGSLQPGADLNSVELATRFGSSRTPVREALMLLEKEGLVEIPPRRRPRVAHITWREIEEMYHIRAELNAMMIRLFAAHASAAALHESQQGFERMRAFAARDDIDAFVEERGRLHDHWAEQCGNATLQKMLTAWRMRLSNRRMVKLKPEHVERSLIDHQRLMLALTERNAVLASALIHAMTLSGLEAIRQNGWFDAGARKPVG
jgi:DNA-binding GntR family transcriptional regulator